MEKHPKKLPQVSFFKFHLDESCENKHTFLKPQKIKTTLQPHHCWLPILQGAKQIKEMVSLRKIDSSLLGLIWKKFAPWPSTPNFTKMIFETVFVNTPMALCCPISFEGSCFVLASFPALDHVKEGCLYLIFFLKMGPRQFFPYLKREKKLF